MSNSDGLINEYPRNKMTVSTIILIHRSTIHLVLILRNYLEPTDTMADTRNSVPLVYSAMYQINSLNTCIVKVKQNFLQSGREFLLMWKGEFSRFRKGVFL